MDAFEEMRVRDSRYRDKGSRIGHSRGILGRAEDSNTVIGGAEGFDTLV